VAHICNPSYSRYRDEEDCSSKSAWAISLRDVILINPSQKKRAGGVAQGETPEFKPQLKKTKPNKQTKHHGLVLGYKSTDPTQDDCFF
jgi:hypothetical protein